MNRFDALNSLRNISLISVITLSALMFSCAESPKNENSEKKTEEAEEKNSNLFAIEGKVFSVPSPIQTAFLLKEVGTEFQSALMHNTDDAKKYVTTHEKALNLGIYGADLGYSTIYDQSQEALAYMAVSKRLTEDLGISGIYNEELLERFENNIGNEDSLMTLVSDAFKTANRYLKDSDQEDLSALILAGGWVETLHFATQLANMSNMPEIRNRIGEQKITIENMINLLLPHQKNEEVSKLINDLNELKDIYAGITFSYEFKEPETDAESKRTVIKSVSSVEMTKEQMSDITDKVTAMRNRIIK